MSRLSALAYLALGLGALFGGTALGRYVGLRQVFAVGVGLVPALLLTFPLLKRVYGGRVGFKSWATVVAGMAVAAALIGALIS